MNLYVRYFDYEELVYTVEEALDFLASLPDIELTDTMVEDIREYAASDNYYPKRYKVRQRAYFIIIKTTAQTMLDFKQKKALNPMKTEAAIKKSTGGQHEQQLFDNVEGWYNGRLDFKRVVMVPQTGKFEYRDTHVEYNCKAVSGQDCYERIVEHLRERVDRRSQFPSPKGKNFHFTYLGKWK